MTNIKVLQEITKDWASRPMPNHTYFVRDNKVLGFIPQGSVKLIKFSKPMMFSKSFRKFKDVTSDYAVTVIIEFD